MPKGLAGKSWNDIQQEMSVSGSPEKIVNACKQVMGGIAAVLDTKNAAEIINMELGLKRVLAEVSLWKSLYEQRTGQKIQ